MLIMDTKGSDDLWLCYSESWALGSYLVPNLPRSRLGVQHHHHDILWQEANHFCKWLMSHTLFIAADLRLSVCGNICSWRRFHPLLVRLVVGFLNYSMKNTHSGCSGHWIVFNTQFQPSSCILYLCSSPPLSDRSTTAEAAVAHSLLAPHILDTAPA